MADERSELVTAVGAALAELQAAYDDRDRALAEALGVNRTDLRCLDLIVRHGPMTASELGTRLHLTRGSMTVLVDRLERAGYAERHDDPHHGRRKLILPTPALLAAIAPLVDAARERGHRRLDGYTAEQLRLIHGFLTETCQAQEALVEGTRMATGGTARPVTG